MPGRQIELRVPDVERRRSNRFARELERDKLEAGNVLGTFNLLGATVDDVIVYDGLEWVPVGRDDFLSLDQLSDVIITAAASGQVLQHNGTNWVNTSLVGVLALTDLSDVTLTAPATGAFLVKTAGDWIDQNFTPARLGIGTATDPTHRLELEDTDHTAWFTGSGTAGSTSAGFRLSKVKTVVGEAHGYALHSDGAACWEMGMAADTDNALRAGFGNADWGLYEYGAAGFCLRISPEEPSTNGTATKFSFAKGAATPRAFTSYVRVQPPSATLRALVLKAHASQSVPLLEWWTSADVVLGQLGHDGRVTLPTAVIASANHGMLSAGSGPFDGVTAGFFTGAALGTELAINTPLAFDGSLFDLQQGGVSRFLLKANGALYLPRIPGTETTNGTFNAGHGPFDGVSAGFFTGSSGGQILALNSTSGFAGRLAEFQRGGVSVLRLVADGRVGIGVASTVSSQLYVTRPAVAANPSNPTYFRVQGVADTAMAASTEVVDVDFALNRTLEFATGALTNQRAARFMAPTYGFVGPSTITNAATLYVDRAPQAGANATITNPYGLWIDDGMSRFDGRVTAPNYSEAYAAKTAAYTITDADGMIAGDATAAAFTVTLPTAVGRTGIRFTVKKVDASANAVTIDGDGAETIDGAATAAITTPYDSLSLVSNGSNWWLV